MKNILGNGNSRSKEKETQGAGRSQGPATIHYGPHRERHEVVAGGRLKSTANEVQSPTVLISRAEVL